MGLSEYMDGDLDAMMDSDVFGIAATVGGAPVTALFDRPYMEAQDAAGYAPVLWCKTSDVSAVVEGTAVTVNGTGYTVVRIENDGTGVTGLVLMES